MSPRLPTPSDFPAHLTLSITPPPSSSSPATNALILLHGLGDTHLPLHTLSQTLNLPETVCISLRAPSPLPFDIGGWHWGDDVQFSGAGGEIEYDTGFTRSTRTILDEIIEAGLIQRCGYTHRAILLFGLGQGGMAALAVAAALADRELGGVISLGGVVPRECAQTEGGTPVLVAGGERGTQVTKTGLERTKRVFKGVEYVKWSRAGDGMARDRGEMMPVMKFFARRLKSRVGVPEGAVEIG